MYAPLTPAATVIEGPALPAPTLPPSTVVPPAGTSVRRVPANGSGGASTAPKTNGQSGSATKSDVPKPTPDEPETPQRLEPKQNPAAEPKDTDPTGQPRLDGLTPPSNARQTSLDRSA
jgi:hypothetical protein